MISSNCLNNTKASKVCDWEARQRLAKEVFPTDFSEANVQEFFGSVAHNKRILRRAKRKADNAANLWWEEYFRSFSTAYALYLACARDPRIATQVDDRCKKYMRMMPELTDRIARAYISRNPDVINTCGPALRGAAVSMLTPDDVLDALCEQQTSFKQLAEIANRS
jgi:hypothetical protein